MTHDSCQGEVLLLRVEGVACDGVLPSRIGAVRVGLGSMDNVGNCGTPRKDTVGGGGNYVTPRKDTVGGGLGR